MSKSTSYILFLLIFLSGLKTYAQKQDIIEIPKGRIFIPYQIKEIFFTDNRINKQPMNWKLPGVFFKAKEFVGNPELSYADSTAIKTMINNSQSLTGTPIKITVVINEGVGKLYGDWKSVKENVRVQIDLKVEELEGSGSVSSSYELSNEKSGIFNAQEKSVLATYSLAMRYAVYQCLLQLSKAATDNPPPINTNR